MAEIKLRFYNTLSRRLEEFEPLEEGLVKVYTCGPTVYNFIHIGNLRTFLFEDILRRTLSLFGFRVTQVMNLTDVDDKTIREAQAAGVGLRNYTDRYIQAFFEDLDTLRVQRAEHYPRATDFIPQMVDLIKRLEKEGHTYSSEGSVYYRISSFPTYGSLSGVSLDGNIAGARVDSDEYEKEDARDFVLWKAAKENETSWETELGRGRPGWHLECSTMSLDLLGDTFDIHAGGVDLVFPHHENEIAQSEGATGRRFVRYWLHSEHLVVEGEKMSKSKGNYFTLRDLTERGYDPLVIRYLLISVPYRQKLNFTFDGLQAAAQAVDRISNTFRRLENSPAVAGEGDLSSSEVEVFSRDLRDALGDDLNTARALGSLHILLRKINTALDGGGISKSVREAIQKALAEVDTVLDVFPNASSSQTQTAEIQKLVDERTSARTTRDFLRADKIRDQLEKMGVVVEDTPHGAVWHMK